MPSAGGLVNARSRRRLTDKFSFRLASPYLASDSSFVTGSEIKISTEVIKYRAGGSLIPVKSPGLSDHDPFTATRGATTEILDLFYWKQAVTDASAGALPNIGGALGVGGCGPIDYKCFIDVVQTNRCHEAIKRWRLYGAWPSEFTAADGFDANSSDHVMESMTWEYDYFVLTDPASGGIAGGRPAIRISAGPLGLVLPGPP